ncbi:glycosyltransferase family 4 protein [Saccharothrix hoggarensis]|uniref:Glycosyltransferase family 4 protein n=1 Tax=Saccharothrix hoggarensis TaxID=913853 RepID=A0ABW3QR42_9PSEU
MKVGLLAPPWIPVPPPSYGGIETVVDCLARGLTKAGHDVVVFTVGESEVPVPTRSVRDRAAGDRIGFGEVELSHAAWAYDCLADRDVVHDHTQIGPLWAVAAGRDRVVTTCHGPLAGDLRHVYGFYGSRLPVVAISHDQAARAPDVRVHSVIHHGVDPERFPSGRGDGGYLLFLGRMTPDKGAREAIEIARTCHRPLKIAAKMREATEFAYFHDEVEPLLGGDVEYVGEADVDDKLRLLADASALLNPIRWAEPFGLVMIEALACGTPVLTYATGSAPEIVEHGVTGFVCADHAELVAAVDRVDRLRREDCRAAVSEYFSTERMVADHIRLYETVRGEG